MAKRRKTADVFEAIKTNVPDRYKNVNLSDVSTTRKWFSRIVKETASKYTQRDILKTKRESLFSLGNMYFYSYDPKHKKTLPYYDRFPLHFPFAYRKGDKGEKGWLTINVHYLPPLARARYFEMLLDYRNNDNMNSTTKLRLTWQLLDKMSHYSEFCVKHHLAPFVRSKIVKIPPSEWAMAVLLPFADFQKKSNKYVWSESKRHR